MNLNNPPDDRHANRIEVYQRGDKRWDFRVIATENGNTLANSSQGYESRAEATAMAHRVTHAPVATLSYHKPDGTVMSAQEILT